MIKIARLTSSKFQTICLVHAKRQSTIHECSANILNNLVSIRGKTYRNDSCYNISPKILDLLNRNLHNQKNHPLWLIKSRIVDFFYKRPAHKRSHENSAGGGGSPLFSVHDSISPVVSTFQNFDSLLVAPDHVSRRPTDTYYVNATTVLRSHTSAHEMDLIKSGLNAFLVVGDVYRRDDIDALHYPAFHQLEGVRLFSQNELFKDAIDPSGCFNLFEPSARDAHAPLVPLSEALPSSDLPPDRQPRHSIETTYCLEFQLKRVLEELAIHLFGKDIPMRWVPAYFPFTHPSWELEVQTGVLTGNSTDGWTEMLGCGILRQEILDHSGVTNKVAYAFGLGLERWAMKLYSIPDIRLFWSQDSGFLNQFKTDDFNQPIHYKAVSVFPPCHLDISFWLPSETDPKPSSSSAHLEFERDFFELVRGVAGDLVEQVTLIDRFEDKKRSRVSYCYRIVYRDHHRTLTMKEVRPLHQKVASLAESQLKVTVR
uniref:Phenylalanine--tRNA ligase, mitochondrial n=1 Tax=Mesocestoides corti TaxID=53468 RepID=A0A5K3ELN7_MESCO